MAGMGIFLLPIDEISATSMARRRRVPPLAR